MRHGSVFWTYERNLSADDPNRNDIAFPAWGNSWDNPGGYTAVALRRITIARATQPPIAKNPTAN